MDARDRRLAVLLVAAGLLVQLPTLLWGMPGTKAINNAMRILDGEVPYRDFWTMYAPGHFYLVAALFKVFGVHAWVPGIAAQLLIAIDGALLFVITRHLGLPRRFAVLVGAAFVGLHWGLKEVTTYETVLLFLLLALDRFVAYAQGRGSAHLVAAGILCGAGAWFKHDVSFHVAFGAVVGLSAGWLLASGRRPDGWVPPGALMMRVAGGAVAAALPVIALLAWKAGPDAWRDLIVFPATEFRAVRGEAYPPLLPDWRGLAAWIRSPLDLGQTAAVSAGLAKWVQANVPQVAFVIGALVLVRHRRRLGPDVAALTALILATMVLFWASAHVQQNTNFSTLWIFSVLLGTLAWVRGGLKPRTRAAVASLFVVATLAFLVRPVRHVAEIVVFWPDHAVMDFPPVAGIRVPRPNYEFIQPIVSFIREHVPESEPIYAGLMRHDVPVISNQNFYFLAGRRIASRYNEIHPGFVDLESVQREIIDDLERQNVRCAVLWEFGWPKPLMDAILADRRRKIPGIGATLLDEYFRREFQEVARYGEYVLVWRKGGPIPPPAAKPS
jgi:hypothetical protein